MLPLLRTLDIADYTFLVKVVDGGISLAPSTSLDTLLATFETSQADTDREALCRELDREIRYQGSSDIAYFARRLAGQEPGVSLHTVIGDVARTLKVRLFGGKSEEEQLRQLVRDYAAAELGRMSPEEQQRALEDLGVERERATAFVMKSAGVFAIPAIVQAFGYFVVEGLIKRTIFGTIARFLGRQVSSWLFRSVAARFPWWISWVGPAAWTLSIGWTVLDLQGPAMRKTVPIVLYLGVCSMRNAGELSRDA